MHVRRHKLEITDQSLVIGQKALVIQVVNWRDLGTHAIADKFKDVD
jgi:hypothetical protein